MAAAPSHRLILSADSKMESMLRSPLEEAGFKLEVVQSPDVIAAAIAGGLRPAAVLGSLTTPVEGSAFYWEIRARVGAKAPPVVLVLLAGTQGEADRLVSSGVAAVFLAPVPGRRLLRKLKELAALPPPEDSAKESDTTPPDAPTIAPGPLTSLPGDPLAGPISASSLDASLSALVGKDGDLRSFPGKVPSIPTAPLTDKPGPAEDDQSLEQMLGFDVDLRSIPTGAVDLSKLMEKVKAAKPAGAVAAPQAPVVTAVFAVPAADPKAILRWPGDLPTVESGVAILMARTLGNAPIAGTDEGIVSETWKALTNSEIDALKSVGTPGKEPPPTDVEKSLARIAGQRFRLRTALMNAERIAAAKARVEIDDTLVTACKQDIDAVMKESLDPIVQWAVTQGELDLLKQFKSIRESLSQRREDLDRAASRLRGVEQERVNRALLDAEAPVPKKAPLSGRFKTKLLEISTVTAQTVRDHGPMLMKVAAGLAVVSLALNFFVFDTFHLKNRPKVENSTILGVERIDHYDGMMTVTINTAFDMTNGLRDIARAAAPGTTVVIVSGETGRPIATIGRDQLSEIAQGEGGEAPSGETEPTAAEHATPAPTAATPAAPPAKPSPAPAAAPAQKAEAASTLPPPTMAVVTPSGR
jgi:hypothetical protein